MSHLTSFFFVIGQLAWGENQTGSPTPKEIDQRLVRQGHYEKALSKMSLGVFNQCLLRQIADKERDGDVKMALHLYRVYFKFQQPGQYQPAFGEPWDQAALDYVQLVRSIPPPASRDKQGQRDLSASIFYLNRKDYHNKHGDDPPCKSPTDECLKKYPDSIFTPAMALWAVEDCGLHWCHRKNDNRVSHYEFLLAEMQEVGCPEGSRLQVMRAYAEECVNAGRRKGDLKKGFDAFLTLYRSAHIPARKTELLLRAAEIGLSLRATDTAVISRDLYRSLLVDSPQAPEAQSARMGIIRSFLVLGQTDEAIRTLRSLESQCPHESFDGEMLEIADSHYRKGEREACLRLLREVIRRYPRCDAAGLAYLRMAAVYGRQGSTSRMVRCWQKAARVQPVDTHTSLMDASNSRNIAYQQLGEFYAKRGLFLHALFWWHRWQPTSWCGNCLASLQFEKLQRMAGCVVGLTFQVVVPIGLLICALRRLVRHHRGRDSSAPAAPR